MLFHVSVDPRIPIGARGPGRDIMERLGVFHAVLPAQFPAPRQPELLDVIAIGSDVVIAQQREALVALRQLGPQSRSQVPCPLQPTTRASSPSSRSLLSTFSPMVPGVPSPGASPMSSLVARTR